MKTNLYQASFIVLLTVLLTGLSFYAQAQSISTFAGNNVAGYMGDNGPAVSAELNHPKGVAVDDTGNVYVADAGNNVVRKINKLGIITTIAGNGTSGYSGDGLTATAATLNAPNSVLLDNLNNLYISDADNYCIRKVNTAGIISTIAGVGGVSGYIGDGGPATVAEMSFPGGIALDPSGNLYISDEYNYCIRKVTPSGIISTYAGAGGTGYTGDGGPATAANIGFPFGIAADGFGNVYISLTLDDRILKIDTAGDIKSIAGDGTGGFTGDGGPATAAEFDNPWGIASDGAGNIYVADNANERIRKITTSGIIYTVAGNGSSGYFGDGGLAIVAKIRDPAGVMVSPDGTFYIADYNNHVVRKVGGTWTHPPSFTGGHSQALSACPYPTPNSIDTQLQITDLDTGQFESWQVVKLPDYGTLNKLYGTVSTGGTVTPTGLTYTFLTGAAIDTFKIRITDGTASDTTTIYVFGTMCTPDHTNSQVANTTNGIKIFPNPSTGTFTFNLTSGNNEKATVIVTDVVGKKVKEFMVNTNTPTEIKLDEAPGLYFLDAVTSHGTWMGKILIER